LTVGAPTFVTVFTKVRKFGLNVAKGISEGKDFGDAFTEAATDAYKDYNILIAAEEAEEQVRKLGDLLCIDDRKELLGDDDK
jgi:hypothetical protein